VDPGSYFANGVALDADGGAVAFRTGARLLGTDLDDERDVYVRDLATQALTLVSAPGDGFGSTARPSNPDLSADGRRVAFTATTPTTADDEDWPAAVFVHDLDSGRNEPASTGLGGAPANRQMRDPALSGDGRCVAFDSDATNLVDVSLSGDFERVYLHALRGGACPTGPGTDTPAATPIAPGGSGVVPPLASILAARLTRTRFAVGVARTLLSSRRRARRGTTVLFSLAAPGMLRMTVERRLAGRRSGRRCVAPTRRTRRRRPCTRIVAAGPAIKRPGLAAGPGRLAFSGRLGRRALRPGRYQARLVGVNAAGAISDPRVLRFTIVRR
jgi:hypothetical protein